MSGHATPTEPTIVRLRRRSEFLAAARGVRLSRAAFVLQALSRPEPQRAGTIGIGLTVTRKIGSAVTRNRARRRLREALRQVLPGPARPATDYVVIARPPALTFPFTRLQAELTGAIGQIARRRER